MSTENEGLLEVRDLKVHFPLPKKSLFGERSYVKAVDGVSFRVRKGTTFGIVGESGSGKTTIAKAVMGWWASRAVPSGWRATSLWASRRIGSRLCAPSTRSSFRTVLLAQPRMRVGKIVQDL